MFDSVLDRGAGPKGRFGTGAFISVVLHVGLFALAVWLSSRPQPEEEEQLPTEVTFKTAMAPPPPPPPPPPPKRKTQVTPKKPKKDLMIPPKEIPQAKPPEVEPTEEPPAEEPPAEEASEAEVEEGVEGGVEGGVVGGVVGGVLGGVIGGQLGGSTGQEVVPFGEGMTRPVPISPPRPEYTREALEARVQGLMIVKCVISIEGRLERCRIIKPLPHMEKAVLDALYAARYKPVTFQGRPVTVDYVFQLRLQLPQ